ncbi:hypothetical protein RZS08_13200, partial [Arthrospira platensis SPKY1]|nr:hypothetical protein [Arthrospira platensis SPKY1]
TRDEIALDRELQQCAQCGLVDRLSGEIRQQAVDLERQVLKPRRFGAEAIDDAGGPQAQCVVFELVPGRQARGRCTVRMLTLAGTA